MTAVHHDPVTTTDFEAIAAAVERTTDALQLEYIDGKLGFKTAPDGDHNRIINWLLLLLMPLAPGLFLHQGQGLKINEYRDSRARPDEVVAPLDAFVGHGEWAPSRDTVMAVEVTSHDSDTNKRDRVEKPTAYAEAGIPLYLLVDRDTAEIVLYSEPDGGRYQETRRYAFGRAVPLPDPISITVDTTPLLDWVD
ncbi:Uma2 family endonuclease [Nocardia sp. NPDC058658]|uniref:Uma2 family endonuclease n=1 Tax=Nocardia sp. NPDC058658 TaxID=3346580 RepID=UPI00365C1DCB